LRTLLDAVCTRQTLIALADRADELGAREAIRAGTIVAPVVRPSVDVRATARAVHGLVRRPIRALRQDRGPILRRHLGPRIHTVEGAVRPGDAATGRLAPPAARRRSRPLRSGRQLPVRARNPPLEVIDQAEARQTLEALRLGIHFLLVEAEEGRA